MKPKYDFFPTVQLQQLLNNIQGEGYHCIGPQVRDGAIIYDAITSVEQLPYGITDTQAPGSYSLSTSTTAKYFDWANGPQAIKPLLFTPREQLWHSTQSADGTISFKTADARLKPLAIIGARACDIAAMRIQDQHFLQQQFVDPYYQARREKLLIIAVNCSSPADTCFCHSTGDGPFNNMGIKDGADIILTELEHGFLIHSTTEQGKKLLSGLELHYQTADQKTEAEWIEQQASQQKRQLPTLDIQSRLLNELDNDTWHSIAAQCLSCGNCTAVCPTCFCHSENEVPSLDAQSSTHYREWDSCFSQGHSYIHGFTIRSETSQHYRQWLTHKFAFWHEQFGRSGCVGCGRCISWCPVGIDVTESINSLLERRRG